MRKPGLPPDADLPPEDLPPNADLPPDADLPPEGGSYRVPLEDTIDLHAFAPRDIPSVVEEYVRAAHEAGWREVRLIHGRGKGVQRGIVQSVLEKHPLVESFYDATESHLGATVAVLSGLKAGAT